MAGFTYDTLSAALQAWTEDDASEFQANIPTIIMLGETRCIRDLNVSYFDDVFSTTMTAGQYTLSKPSGTVAVRGVQYVNSSGTTRYLNQNSYEWARTYWPRATQTSVPKGWWDLSEDTIGIFPTPDSNYTTLIRALVRPDGLSSSNQNTWLASNQPDLLFYACIWESERYLKFDSNDFQRVKQYEDDYTNRILPAARLEMIQQQKVLYAAPREVPDVGGETS